MLIYFVIMLVFAVLFLIIGLAIYRGKTELIHDYHRRKVREDERQEYGRSFAKGMFAICATLLLSGVIALFDDTGLIIAVSLVILFAGLMVSFIILAKVQKKYNGGIF